VAQIHEVFAIELPIRALFEEPTVRGLARQIEAVRPVRVQKGGE
jgi:hypothetical protein